MGEKKFTRIENKNIPLQVEFYLLTNSLKKDDTTLGERWRGEGGGGGLYIKHGSQCLGFAPFTLGISMRKQKVYTRWNIMQ